MRKVPDVQQASATVPAQEPPPSAPVGMPSFIGLSMRTALERARDLGWAVQIVGSGYVASQTAYLAQQLARLQTDAGNVGHSVASFETAVRRLGRDAAALKHP